MLLNNKKMIICVQFVVLNCYMYFELKCYCGHDSIV